MYGQLIFEVEKVILWVMDNAFNKWAWKNYISLICKKNESDFDELYLPLHAKK